VVGASSRRQHAVLVQCTKCWNYDDVGRGKLVRPCCGGDRQPGGTPHDRLLTGYHKPDLSDRRVMHDAQKLSRAERVVKQREPGRKYPVHDDNRKQQVAISVTYVVTAVVRRLSRDYCGGPVRTNQGEHHEHALCIRGPDRGQA
jgi:hypothetical protein